MYKTYYILSKRQRSKHQHIFCWIAIACLLFAFTPSLKAQSADIDSLRNVWKNKLIHDTTRMNALRIFLVHKKYLPHYPDSVYAYAQEGYNLANRKKLHFYRVAFLLLQGMALSGKGELIVAEDYYKRSLSLADSIHNDTLKIKLMINLSGVQSKRSNYASAIDYLLKALVLGKKINYSAHKVPAFVNLGLAYSQAGNDDKALYYYNKGLELAKSSKDDRSIVVGYNNIGIIYLAKKDAASALASFVKGLQIAKTSGNLEGLPTLYMNIGDSYALLKETKPANDNYQNALNLFRSKNNLLGEAQILFRIAKTYVDVQSDSMFIMSKRALEIARKNDFKSMLSDIALFLSEAYQKRDQYQPALEMYMLYSQTQDSIFSKQQQTNVAWSEAQYAYDTKRLQDSLVFQRKLTESKVSAQRNYYAMISIMVLFAIGLYVYNYRRNTKYQIERAEALLKITQLRESIASLALNAHGIKEKSMLDRAQIELHIGTKLGDTSWSILQLLAEKPTISNREIAEALFLSEEGVSSSLRRMYSAFDIQSGNSKNHKIALLSKVIELSVEQYSDSN